MVCVYMCVVVVYDGHKEDDAGRKSVKDATSEGRVRYRLQMDVFYPRLLYVSSTCLGVCGKGCISHSSTAAAVEDSVALVARTPSCEVCAASFSFA